MTPPTSNKVAKPGFVVHDRCGMDPEAPTQKAGAQQTPRPARDRRIAGYDLMEVIGEGGMGIVYRARHLGLGKDVALKLLEGGSQADVARFVHEARAMAAL